MSWRFCGRGLAPRGRTPTRSARAPSPAEASGPDPRRTAERPPAKVHASKPPSSSLSGAFSSPDAVLDSGGRLPGRREVSAAIHRARGLTIVFLILEAIPELTTHRAMRLIQAFAVVGE